MRPTKDSESRFMTIANIRGAMKLRIRAGISTERANQEGKGIKCSMVKREIREAEVRRVKRVGDREILIERIGEWITLSRRKFLIMSQKKETRDNKVMCSTPTNDFSFLEILKFMVL